jgi:hypothetical protein
MPPYYVPQKLVYYLHDDYYAAQFEQFSLQPALTKSHNIISRQKLY